MGYTARGAAIESIATLVHQERPEWDLALIRYVLSTHASLVDGSDLAQAAIRCAQNRDMPGPKAIGWRGPHWRGLDTMPLEVRAPARCGVCGKPEPRCYAERPGRDDDHAFEPRQSA